MQRSVMQVQSYCFALSSYCFFYFLVAASSSTSYYLRYIVIRQKLNFLSANQLLLIVSETFFDSPVVPSFQVNELGNCGEIITVVYELKERTHEMLFADWAQ